MINRTGFRVGPGAYPFKLSTNRGISAVIKKDYHQQDPALKDPFVRNSVHSIKSEKSLLLRSQSAVPQRKRNTVATICPTMSTLTLTQSSLGVEKARKSLGNSQRERIMIRSASVAKTKPYDLLDILSFQELAAGPEKGSSSNYMRTEPHEKIILTER